jgi:fumarate reductase flavoprotein subunit
VVVLEKQPHLGGTTGIAIGSFTANSTSLQRAAGIRDNAHAHDEDAGGFPPSEYEARNHSELRRFFLEESGKTFEWLRGMGLAFYGPSPEPPNRVARMHNVIPNAKAYIAVMQSRLLRLGGRIEVNADVTELVREGDRVRGVRYRRDGRSLEAKARRGVILAAGDYANNSALKARHRSRAIAEIEGINEHAQGDGHLLVESVGGELVNMDIFYGPEIRFVAPARRPFTQLLPASGFLSRMGAAATRAVPKFVMNRMIRRLLVTWQHPEVALFEAGAILVNRAGDRFTDERVSPQREIDIAAQPGKVCYLILDRWLCERFSHWPHFVSTAPDIAYAYVADYRRLRRDIFFEGRTARELGRSMGLPAEAVEQSIEQAEGLGEGPFVGLGPAKAYFPTVEGGARIDMRCRVLRADGSAIRGLYAVGQNGLGGMVLFGHGLHIAWALTSGRLVGKALGEGEFEEVGIPPAKR